MCIGFSVDFSAHISYSFMASDGETAEEKLADALEKVGLPIVQGSVSSIFGVIVLGFIPAYIYRTFFKTVFMVMFFGALHGLLLLPVLLTIFGNIWTPSSKSEYGDEYDEEYGDSRRNSRRRSSSVSNAVAAWGGMGHGGKLGRQLSLAAYPAALQPWPANGKGLFPRPSISFGGKRPGMPQLPPPEDWMDSTASTPSPGTHKNAKKQLEQRLSNGKVKRGSNKNKGPVEVTIVVDGNQKRRASAAKRVEKRGSSTALQHSPSTSESSLHMSATNVDGRRTSSPSWPDAANRPGGLGKYLAERRRESMLSSFDNSAYVHNPVNEYY
jgi:hypothetical protein